MKTKTALQELAEMQLEGCYVVRDTGRQYRKVAPLTLDNLRTAANGYLADPTAKNTELIRLPNGEVQTPTGFLNELLNSLPDVEDKAEIAARLKERPNVLDKLEQSFRTAIANQREASE